MRRPCCVRTQSAGASGTLRGGSRGGDGAGADDIPSALLHPRLAQIYRGKIERLLGAFESESGRSEAQEIIRSLIDAMVVTPVDGVLRAEVKGDLATMLVLVSDKKKAPDAGAFEADEVRLVAGTGFEPVTFRL